MNGMQALPLKLGYPHIQLDTPLPYAHRLTLHEPEGCRVSLLRPRTCHDVQCVVQPLLLALDLLLSRT